MKRSGPLYTLLAGLALAVVMLSLNATTGSAGASYGETPPSATPSSPSPSASLSPTPSPSPSPSPSPPPDADYAGRTADGVASVAIALRGGKAIAYACDGRSKEAWLRGDVGDDGAVRLTGEHGAKLEGTLGDNHGRITGTVELTDRTWKFTAAKAVKPSGLYRATARVSGAKIDGGWIVLPGGKQVGIVDRDGVPSAAPSIDPETGAVTIDGVPVTAKPVVP
ncbi:hypothetical protein ACFXJ5_25100 [Streptomyces sp. NPDC059373]